MVTFIVFSLKFAGFPKFPGISTLSFLVRKKKRLISHISEIQHSSRREHSLELGVILWAVTAARASGFSQPS